MYFIKEEKKVVDENSSHLKSSVCQKLIKITKIYCHHAILLRERDTNNFFSIIRVKSYALQSDRN